jgi:CheY-like chemotaxis protein
MTFLMSAARAANILVVDDDASTRTLLELILSSGGHEITLLNDGREALAYLKTHTPDLIVIDVNMPVLDGIEVCSRVKKLPRFRNTPVIVLTSMNDAGTRVRAIDANASEIVYKPLTGKNFLQTVQVLLKGVQEAKDSLNVINDD